MFTPQLIKGTITHLQTLEGKSNFVLSGGARAATGAAAAGAAVVGSFFSSSILARSALALKEDSVFFTCVVNGIKLSGCFNTLNITEGEEVELVIDTNHNQSEGAVYAIRKPKERCLWVVPMMEGGHGSMKRTAVFLPLALLKYFLPFSFIFIFLIESFIKGSIQIISPLITVLGGGVLLYCTMAFGVYVTFIGKAKLATQVIAALGFDDPANVGLGLVSTAAVKQWEEEHGKPFPKDQHDGFAFYY